MTYYTPTEALEPWWLGVPRCVHCGETSGMHIVTDDEQLRCVPAAAKICDCPGGDAEHLKTCAYVR